MTRSPLRRQFELLRRARSFNLLFLATLGSGIGTGLAVIALIVDVFDRTDSGKWVAALLIVDFLPMLAIGLLLGPLVDPKPCVGRMMTPRRSSASKSDRESSPVSAKTKFATAGSATS